MKRPEQHVTDTLGIAQMRACFEPLGWTVNKIENDYGCDYEVEVFRNGQTTGISFKLQLKSSLSTPYSAASDFISEEINIANAYYMCRELRTPILLVHADIGRKRTFWSAVQLDVTALRALGTSSFKKTLTFRIPTENSLPETWQRLLDSIVQSETVLSLRALSEQPIPDFLAAIDGKVDKDEVSQQLKNKSDAVRLDRARELLRSGSYEDARAKVVSVLQDANASIENRFWAFLTAESVELGAARVRNTLRRDQVNIQLEITSRLRALTRKGPPHLKFFALIAWKAAELHALAHADFGMHINAQVNQKDGDSFWKAQLRFAQARSAQRIARKYNQCARLAGYAVNYPFRWALPQALLRIVYALLAFLIRLRTDGWSEAANAYRDRALQIIKLAAWLAADCGDVNTFEMSVATASMLAEEPADEIAIWIRQAVPSITDENMKAEILGRLDGLGSSAEDASENREMSVAEEQQVYEEMAASLGIDLSDPNDKIAWIVRVGIKDLNPGRVLKNCEHLFVSLGSHGAIGDWMKLPTAGSKFLHCTLHGHGIGGLSLDDVYQTFKQQFCDKCGDCAPRPAEWEYSSAWQIVENGKHAKFAERGRF